MPKLKHAKMEAFCQHHVGKAKGNRCEAARLAGYKNARASADANMKKDVILERIEELSAEVEAQADGLTKEEIHGLWASIARDDEMSASDRLTALRDAARAKRMFVTQIEAKHTIEKPEQLMSDDELLAEAARLEELAQGSKA